MKLLVQGVTLLAAAGDSGVTGDGYGYSSCGYNPVFPASSIYVTAVGGTQGMATTFSIFYCFFIYNSCDSLVD
jgi:subtilase family serine protease